MSLFLANAFLVVLAGIFYSFIARGTSRLTQKERENIAKDTNRIPGDW